MFEFEGNEKQKSGKGREDKTEFIMTKAIWAIAAVGIVLVALRGCSGSVNVSINKDKEAAFEGPRFEVLETVDAFEWGGEASVLRDKKQPGRCILRIKEMGGAIAIMEEECPTQAMKEKTDEDDETHPLR